MDSYDFPNKPKDPTVAAFNENRQNMNSLLPQNLHQPYHPGMIAEEYELQNHPPKQKKMNGNSKIMNSTNSVTNN